jgi:hypothetical protein
MQTYLNALITSLQSARGDGNLSDNLHWGHVGDLRLINTFLEHAM